MEEVVIVGAGIAGLATAVGLKRVGITTLVLERADKLRVSGAVLTLSSNAWIALDVLGLSHKLTSLYPPLSRPVDRKVLLQTLADELPPNSIRFSSNITSIQSQQHLTILHLEDGTVIKSKVVIGCDGVNSVVGRWLGLSEPIYSRRSAVLGLANLPENQLKEIKQFVDAGRRAALVPMNKTEVYWFLIFPQGKDNMTRDPKEIQKQVIEKYGKDMPSMYLDVVREADLSTLTLAPLKLRLPWNVIFGTLSRGNVTVAGDAMHPMTPELGQGGCSALEDAVVLSRHIGNSFIRNSGRIVAEEMSNVLKGYVKERRWRAAGLIVGSYISGWIQLGGSNALINFFRDKIFYGFLFRPLLNAVSYDCGKLPSAKTE